jgi:anti-sigma factor RsiW
MINEDPMSTQPGDTNELPNELKQNMTRYQAPPGLRRRLRFMLEQQARADLLLPQRGWWPRSLLRWAPLGASFAFGLLLGVSVMHWQGLGQGDDRLEQQLVADHVRSLMAGHLADVASTDQHTVKPWFNGKLDYAPPVFDLKGEGFPLVGGRLDYLDGRAVAALVYQRRLHTINVFVRPERGTRPLLGSSTTSEGYNLFGWRAAGMQFLAVSDVSGEDLKQLARAIQSAAGT